MSMPDAGRSAAQNEGSHPPPEVHARLANAAEIPRAAARVQRLAQGAGWTVVATYARGTRPGRNPRVVDSVALRMSRSQERAVAVWLDGKFDLAFTWGGAPLQRISSKQLSAALEPARLVLIGHDNGGQTR